MFFELLTIIKKYSYRIVRSKASIVLEEAICREELAVSATAPNFCFGKSGGGLYVISVSWELKTSGSSIIKAFRSSSLPPATRKGVLAVSVFPTVSLPT